MERAAGRLPHAWRRRPAQDADGVHDGARAANLDAVDKIVQAAPLAGQALPPQDVMAYVAAVEHGQDIHAVPDVLGAQEKGALPAAMCTQPRLGCTKRQMPCG